MKNLYLVPTNSESTLSYRKDEKYFRFREDPFVNNSTYQNYGMVIVSDEEFDKGDYGFIETDPECKVGKILITSDGYEFGIAKGVSMWYGDYHSLRNVCKKIIMTTNKKLIQDGVQAIPDEFLELFANTPMEYVEFEKEYLSNDGNWKRVLLPSEWEVNTKIRYKITPICYDKFNQLLKEGDYVDVQKDGVQQIYKKEDGELYFKPYGKEDKVWAYFSNDLAKCDEVGNWINNDSYEHIEVPNIIDDWLEKHGNPEIAKQVEIEAKELDKDRKKLEKAAKKYRKTTPNKMYGDELGFIDGAMWERENSNLKYSIQDVRNAAYQAVVHVGTWDSSNIVSKMESWFEDFKNKENI